VGLVVPSRIEGEPTDQLPVFAQHPDVAVGHEHEHPGADEPTSQPDVVRPRVVAKRDRAGDVDLVPSDPEVGRDYEPRQPWRRLRPSCERLGGGTPADRPVRPDLVVVAPEAVELHLELADARRRLLPGEPPLEGLVESLDLAAGLG
jgi:hypothetical protein